MISFVVHGKSFGIIREDTDKLEKKNAVESIIIALRDEDSDVRLSIAESPGMIGDRRVDEHLFTAVLVSMGFISTGTIFVLKTLIQVLKDFCLSYILFLFIQSIIICLSFDANRKTDKCICLLIRSS